MPTPRPRLPRVAIAAVVVVLAVGGAVAVALDGVIDQSAAVGVGADRVVRAPGDLVAIYNPGDIESDVISRADAAAQAAGGVATPTRSGSLGMVRLTRAGAVVHAPPPGYMIPMVYSAVPLGAVGYVVGPAVAALLGPGRLVLNDLTAGIMGGAAAGDVLEIRAADGSVRPLVVAGVLPAEDVGGADMIISTDVAAGLGATADTRVVIWGFDDRAALDSALAQAGLEGRPRTKILRSWRPPDPDSLLSTPEVKAALGEPWYGFSASGSVMMHPAWSDANLTAGRVLLSDAIPIRARCHVRIVESLRAALAEVAASGLGGAIDVGNANTYGGCYAPRFTRVSGQIGFLSRHSYGMALDTNTTSNCQGCRPQMNCDVVRIFRRHGFAWGGNFLSPDGMHFEWVGERRDLIPFASNYCPNLVQASTEAADVDVWGSEVLVAGTEMFHTDG